MNMDELHTALQERAQETLRAWYGNPEGKYSGSMVAQLGSTTWRFTTGSGWGEPELVWSAPGQERSPYRMTWYGQVYMHVGQEPADAARFAGAVERLADKLLQLDWHDPRPARSERQ